MSRPFTFQVVEAAGTSPLHLDVTRVYTPELRASIDDRVTPIAGVKILFSGTVVSLQGELCFGRTFSMSLRDPVLGRTIEHTHRTVVLSEEVSA